MSAEGPSPHELVRSLPQSSPDRIFYEINEEVPGFAGVFLGEPPAPGEQGPGVVLTTDMSRADDARSATAGMLAARGLSATGLEVRAADFEWRDLVRWRHQARARLDVQGLRRIGIRAMQNRIKIGVASDGAKESVIRQLQELDLPLDAFEVELAGVARPTIWAPDRRGVSGGGSIPSIGAVLNPALVDKVRPVLGGLAVSQLDEPECTLGFTVEESPEPLFAMAWHCALDPTVHQPHTLNRIGDDVEVPTWFEHGDPEDHLDLCPDHGPSRCRYADAALVEYEDTVSPRWAR